MQGKCLCLRNIIYVNNFLDLMYNPVLLLINDLYFHSSAIQDGVENFVKRTKTRSKLVNFWNLASTTGFLMIQQM